MSIRRFPNYPEYLQLDSILSAQRPPDIASDDPLAMRAPPHQAIVESPRHFGAQAKKSEILTDENMRHANDQNDSARDEESHRVKNPDQLSPLRASPVQVFDVG